jgi:predicted transcriptional regulator
MAKSEPSILDTEPSIFDEVDQAFEDAADAEAEADIAAGRVVPHEEVVEWLKTWGTPEEKPPPASWFK